MKVRKIIRDIQKKISGALDSLLPTPQLQPVPVPVRTRKPGHRR